MPRRAYKRRRPPAAGGGGPKLRKTRRDNNNNNQKTDDNPEESLFPRKIWILILDRVGDPNTFHNLVNTSAYFRTLLQPRRTAILFPLVVGPLLQGGYLESHAPIPPTPKAGRRGRKAKDNIPPGVRPYSPILRCRLVSRGWKAAMDQFYEGQNTRGDLQEQEGAGLQWWENEFRTRDQLTKALDYFRESHQIPRQNPFIGRQVMVYLRVDNETPAREYWTGISKLLKFYGSHFHALHLFVTDLYPSTCSEAYLRLRQVLRWVPNLILLRLHHTPAPGGQINTLGQEIRTNFALPVLPHLQVLITRHLLSPVFQELLRSNPHIRHLSMEGQSLLEGDVDYRYAHQMLPHLRHLAVQVHTDAQLRCLMQPTNHWALHSLRLTFDPGFFVEWPQVFRWIYDKGATTLTSLEITAGKLERIFEKRRLMRWSKNAKMVNFRNLRKLTLRMGNLSTLDFLLPLGGTLEELEVQLRFDMNVEMGKKSNAPAVADKQRMDFVGFQERRRMLEESNIWREMGKLRVIRFEEVRGEREIGENKWVVTREQWRQFQEERERQSKQKRRGRKREIC